MLRRREVDLEETLQARETAEFFLEISRALLALISVGDSSEASEGAKRFHEDRYIRRKWGNLPVFSPISLLPVLQFQVAVAQQDYAEPSISEVYDFLKKTFDDLRLPRELAVMSLIYITRLNHIGIELRSTTWRPVIYSCLLVSSKTWEDVSVLNSDFSEIYKPYTLKAINEMEGELMEQLHWRLFITAEEYSEKFYDLQQKQRYKRSRPHLDV